MIRLQRGISKVTTGYGLAVLLFVSGFRSNEKMNIFSIRGLKIELIHLVFGVREIERSREIERKPTCFRVARIP